MLKHDAKAVPIRSRNPDEVWRSPKCWDTQMALHNPDRQTGPLAALMVILVSLALFVAGIIQPAMGKPVDLQLLLWSGLMFVAGVILHVLCVPCAPENMCGGCQEYADAQKKPSAP